jgi:hypothetical protein
MYRIGVKNRVSRDFFGHKAHEITVKGKIVGNKDGWLVVGMASLNMPVKSALYNFVLLITGC